MKAYCPRCKTIQEIDIAYSDSKTIHGDCSNCKTPIRIAKHREDLVRVARVFGKVQRGRA